MLNSLPYIALVLLLQSVQVAVALSHLKIQTPGPITQCGRVTIPLEQGNFIDGRADDPAPVGLTILPFNSSNIVIPVSGLTRTSASIQLDFLPMRADVPFLLSLSDARNELLGFMSDVIRIQPSDVTDCFPGAFPPRVYSIPDQLMQCEVFEVSYNTSRVTTAPLVKAVTALGVSYNIPRIENEVEGDERAFYTLNAFRGFQMALAIDDGEGNSETTALFPVFGDSATSKDCISFGNFTEGFNEEKNEELPIAALIGIGVGIGVFVVVLTGIMVFFVLRSRRRRREETAIYHDFFMAQGGSGDQQTPVTQPVTATTLPSPSGSGTTTRYVVNPTYTSQFYGEDERARRSTDSWLAVSVRNAPLDSPAGARVDMVRQQPQVQDPGRATSTEYHPAHSRMASFDIVHMLDTAESAGYQLEAESSKHSSQQPDPKKDTPETQTHHLTQVRHSLEDIPTSPIVVSPVTPESFTETVSSRQKRKVPVDVPMDPASFISNTSNAMFDSFPQAVGQLATPHSEGYRISHLTTASESNPAFSPTTPIAPRQQPRAF